MPNRFARRAVGKTDFGQIDAYEGSAGSIYLGLALAGDTPISNEDSWPDDAEKPAEAIPSFEGAVDSPAAQLVWRMR
jgi:hypothetical protein